MPSNFVKRIQALRRIFQSHNYGGMVVSKPKNITFLTGLASFHPTNRESLLFITSDKAFLYHSAFSVPPKLPEINPISMQTRDALPSILSAFQLDLPIAIEGNDLTVNELKKLEENAPGIKFKPAPYLIETQRMTKSKEEITTISKASRITLKVMETTLKKLKNQSYSGITERQLAIEIERALIDNGAEGLAFPVIVAVNANASLPHHNPGKTMIDSNSVVLLDFGCQVGNYCSDMTRTVKLGENSQDFSRVEQLVKASYKAGISVLRSVFQVISLTSNDHIPLNFTTNSIKSLEASRVDNAVRTIMKDAGFGEYYIHTSGHGLGLEIHEQPSLHTASDQMLTSNMTITLEPGIYLPSQFGYRYENTLLLT